MLSSKLERELAEERAAGQKLQHQLKVAQQELEAMGKEKQDMLQVLGNKVCTHFTLLYHHQFLVCSSFTVFLSILRNAKAGKLCPKNHPLTMLKSPRCSPRTTKRNAKPSLLLKTHRLAPLKSKNV